jgi:predicted CXXCH cytochrome family protein
MVNNFFEIRCSVLLKAALALLLLFSRPGGDCVAAEVDKPECDYRQYLDEEEYLSMKAEMELIARIRSENMARGVTLAATEADNNLRELDDFSKECISCHAIKGYSASEDINNPKHPGMSAISVTHGIGTDYVSSSMSRSNLRRADELPLGMTLVNGRIACITCHNLMSSQQYNLAVENRGSALCFACHQI